MTTINEMDEFFNFEDAAHSSELPHDFPSAPLDIDLAFANEVNDEDSFSCLQHFNGDTSEQQISLNIGDAMQDTDMNAFTAQDFTDFPRWIDGMNVPFQPCEYCREMKIHCKALKEGVSKGSCTSCVALARSCSLTYKSNAPPLNVDSYQSGENICVPDNVAAFDARLSADEALADWNDVTQSTTWLPTKSTVQEMDHSPQASMPPGPMTQTSSTENLISETVDIAPKAGARFSREALRVLRGWISTHHRHPYPTEEEKEGLRRQTGLSKIQITNWLANARRRGKVRAPRSTSPAPNINNYARGMDIPRRGTPALRDMNPLDRWKNSPPEHEAASVTAIAKAVTSSTFSSGRESPYTSYGHTDDGSARSLWNVSSASSLGTSHGTSHSSGGSFASAYSHKSRGSFGSFNSMGNRGRRRRRRQAPSPAKNIAVPVAPRTYQCTFCTETFKTKHDWQRHEKSLHLSLERWICSPSGPNQHCIEYNHLACVYCGLPNPPEGHSEQHNHSGCAERSLEERTFYRKDHLRQHLSLVHDAKFQAWSMDLWKAATPEIRSRCGFCGIVMDSWTFRVDHLAEHFKGGKSMADWKGDWGFESQVLDIVENGIPPYLIHDERNTMRPFQASTESADSDRTHEDLVKMGLVDFINSQVVQEIIPTDEDLLKEARKIIMKAEALSKTPLEVENSWFRDLIMLSGKHPKHDSNKLQDMDPTGYTEISWSKRLELINWRFPKDRENLSGIRCSKERALATFVHARQSVGLTPTDSELQAQACRILDEAELTTSIKCIGAISWFKYLIASESNWLNEFRLRQGLPRTKDMGIEHIRSTDDTTIDYSIHNFSRLRNELKEYVETQLTAGIIPSDLDLQQKARLIIYKNDDPWNQTAADDPAILQVFKRQNGLAPSAVERPDMPAPSEEFGTGRCQPKTSSSRSLHWDLESTGVIMMPSPVTGGDRHYGLKGGTATTDGAPLHTLATSQPSTNTNPIQPLRYFLNDANCYGRLVIELNNFVKHSMSPNNPNQHIPSDAEIQNQARWVIYDDDDPWNQTAADNAEWLIRFKRHVGLASSESGPGLPLTQLSWLSNMGGTGFSPPYVNAKTPPAPFTSDVSVKMQHRTYSVPAKTAGNFLQSMSERWQKPATVFCSRDLEDGLNAFVRSEIARGVIPQDEQLRAKAREILGVIETAADDVLLLEKFKKLHGISSSNNIVDLDSSLDTTGPLADFTLPNFTDDVEMSSTFNMELGATDLTTAYGAGLGTDGEASLMSFPCLTTPHPQSQSYDSNSLAPITQSLGIRENEIPDMSGVFSEADGVGGLDGIHDYAETHRVHAATASPLRRRASEKMAMQVGNGGLRDNIHASQDRCIRPGQKGGACWSHVMGEGSEDKS